MSSSSKITAVAESVSQNPQVHDKRQHESPDIIDHTNHAAHADEMSSSNMSMKGSAAMSNGDCCNDECSCETSTCSNSSLVAVTQHFITASKYSDHAVAQQCSKPKSISFSFFRPPIIG
ncbi:hypothetical protein ACOJR9_14015 [Alteromonas sp. A081]|uniref:hypothetical protein n=1 Tax=Alteromonas sp. A081 TaxID=3410269 RepID=UPI003B981644